MAISTSQYTPVFLPGEPPSLIEKPGRPQSTGHKELDTTKETLRAYMQDFFACGSSAPVRIEHEGGAAAWLAYAGTRTASAPGVMALSESFFKLAIRRPL